MRRTLQTTAATLLLLPLAGCFVESRKGANGDKDVAISTPLGGMSVKTDTASVQAKVGLPLYPPEPSLKEKDNDSSSADVNMNFGPFHMRVLAMGFTTPDSPEKVRTYYRKALSEYGDVIECRDKHVIGAPTRTGLGLTCDSDQHIHTRVGDVGNMKVTGETELKAGSPSRQHIVTFETKNGGTQFGLVALELPTDEKKSSDTAN